MSKLSGFARFKKIWLNDPATYPILYIMAGAVGVCVFAGSRTLFSHPDVYLSPEKRQQIIRDNAAETESHHEHALRVRAVKSEPQILNSWHSWLVKRSIQKEAQRAKQWEQEDEDD